MTESILTLIILVAPLPLLALLADKLAELFGEGEL